MKVEEPKVDNSTWIFGPKLQALLDRKLREKAELETYQAASEMAEGGRG